MPASIDEFRHRWSRPHLGTKGVGLHCLGRPAGVGCPDETRADPDGQHVMITQILVCAQRPSDPFSSYLIELDTTLLIMGLLALLGVLGEVVRKR